MAKKHTQDTIDNIIELHLAGNTSRTIASKVFGKRSSKSTVNTILKRYRKGQEVYSKGREKAKSHLPKVLLIDIETSPTTFHGWAMFNQNFSVDQIVEEWFIMSYCAKWLGAPDNEVMYEDISDNIHKEDDTKLLDSLWKLLDEADIVIGQNQKKFDIKKIKARMIMNGYQPFSPIKNIDTLEIAKREFAFTSNRLAWLTEKLCTKYKKLDHGKFAGYILWKECLAGNPLAWEEMKKYNIMDVLSLEELYIKMAAWDSKHVNFNLYTDEVTHTCRCGSHRVVENGYAYTNLSKFQQYRCLDCGTPSRGRVNLLSKEKRASLHMNVINP